MRALLYCLPLLPVPALADTFTLPSRASAATIYNSGALVTHDLAVTLPAGSHQIVLPDLPPDLHLDMLRVSAPDLKLGAVRYRADLTPPRGETDTPAIAAAKARIEQIEDQIEDVEDAAARQRLEVEAAEARIAFLAGLGNSDTLPADPAALRELAAMIGTETLAARQTAFDAERAVRATREVLEDLLEALADAKKALAALVPEPKDRPLLVLDVTAVAPVTDAPLAVSFAVEAAWQPTYDLRLSLDPAPQLVIDRGAQVMQRSGENWNGIALTLSTQTLGGDLDAGELYPDLRRIFEEGDLYRGSSLPAPAPSGLTERAMEAPAVMEDAAATMTALPQGLSVTYRWSDPVDVASGADRVRLPFDTLMIDAEVVARAVPLQRDTAYLVAKITNTTGEPFLPGDTAVRFVEGALVGSGRLEAVQAGAEAEIGFGSIDGLQLTRRVLKRGEADRGLISRSNEMTEEVAITLKNLTSRAWQVELRDRVPYSEQEDLVITYRATPEPDVTAVEDKRGVLQWDLRMDPGTERTVATSHRITWPEGQTMR